MLHQSVLAQSPRCLPDAARKLTREPTAIASLERFEEVVKEAWSSPASELPFSPGRRRTLNDIACTAQRHEGRCPFCFLVRAEQLVVENVKEIDAKIWAAGDALGQSGSR